MKRLFASISGLTLMAAFSANAADIGLPIKAQLQPVAAYSWTGCYIGVHGGAGAMQTSSTDQWGGGGLGGGQVGCNYQFERIVLGVEGEGWWSGLKSTFDEAFPTFPTPGNAFTDETAKNLWDLDVSLRAGFAWDRALLYGKAGVAWGRFNMTLNSSGPGFVSSETGAATLYGLLLAIGGEYAFSPDWSAKLEYDFVDYFARVIPFTVVESTVPSSFMLSLSESATKQIVKVGLNYKFTP